MKSEEWWCPPHAARIQGVLGVLVVAVSIDAWCQVLAENENRTNSLFSALSKRPIKLDRVDQNKFRINESVMDHTNDC